MRPAFRLVVAAALLTSLAGCSGPGIKKLINPPRASIQQLAVQPNGQWNLAVRLQNFSNVPMTFQSVSVKLLVSGHEAGSIAVSPGIAIGPESADVVNAVLTPGLGAKLAVASALSAQQSVRYTLTGTIGTEEPRRDYEFSYDSTLNPAPGLNGVMR